MGRIVSRWRQPVNERGRGPASAAGALALSLVLFPGPLAAAPVLQWPAACTAGEDCWVVNYVDTDPREGASRDFTCGGQTYDGHSGTDIAIRDWAALERSVDVLAAAAGRVLRTRDGVEDRDPTEEERRRLLEENRGCGNGVLIEHEGGWQTLYCHMKRGSIAVRPGDSVEAGRKIGQVGQSGNAEFPHLHLDVTRGGEAVDPFTGAAAKEGCGHKGTPLWAPGTGAGYEPVSFYAAGFADRRPDFDRLRRDAGTPETLPAEAGALTFWVAFFGAAQGDRIRMEISGPDGKVFASEDITQEKNRARQFYFIGRRARGGLAPGVYRGSAVLVRALPDGTRIERSITRRVTVGERGARSGTGGT